MAVIDRVEIFVIMGTLVEDEEGLWSGRAENVVHGAKRFTGSVRGAKD